MCSNPSLQTHLDEKSVVYLVWATYTPYGAQNVGPLIIRRKWELIIPFYQLPPDCVEQKPALFVLDR